MNRKKKFDTVEMKRHAQAELYEETKDMSPEETREFYKRRAESGPLGKFWKSIQPKSSKKAVI